ncbi:GNAT family N-acetyltransferase [Streptomyces carminius]|uniref:GNAT family N-acetyltransferase n=1 Tax=Streptomyces carminius TaxID=2665496 RepID=A0A2M8M1E7_9ACTN|nr:GNAT family N-acetyltransferase [Streptomyces carminius]PJE98027.1 GNAT family N-acetyltransferase [Streptomyces carminius]PJF01853.1 GNAT family N-acetyltransferase [Streptomyces carminius]
MTEIRTLTADDWRTWRELRLAALAEAPGAFGSRLADWQGPGDREERWRARLDLPGACHFLALLDGRPAGMAGGVPVPEPAGEGGTAELISMWVAPAARGRGTGDELVRAVVRWAAAAGNRAVRLSVFSGNTHAAALYRRHGFVPTGPAGDPLPDGRREHVMVRTLSTVRRESAGARGG